MLRSLLLADASEPMVRLSPFDGSLVVVYLVVVLAVGFWSYRRTARNLKSYFLGDRKAPWWALAMSGSVSNFDVAGTIWMVSVVMALGIRSYWVFWTFAFLNGAFLMSYMAQWIRRTGVLTAAELIRARFGDDAGGKTARGAAALMAVVYQVFAIGYAFVGVGKFASEYLPLTAHQCALGLVAVTTVYVVIGGFRSVIVTDVIQAVLLNVGGLVIGVIAYLHIDADALHAVVGDDWLPSWTVERTAEAGSYFESLPRATGTLHYFLPMCFLWVFNGLVLSFGGTGGSYGEQRYLAARTGRDAALAGAGWGVFLILRFAMVAGIAYLALVGNLGGGDAGNGLTDHEKALPIVIRDLVPHGVRGLLIVGLLAAFMSTFSSTVNSTVSILTRDLLQPLAPRWSERRLVIWSYGMTVGLVLAGIAIGMNAKTVVEIWEWIIIGLMSALALPNVLRWYWWRLNGWGYASGTFSAMVASLVVFAHNRWFDEPPLGEIPAYVYGPALNAVALVGCVVGSLVTRPVAGESLQRVWGDVRPKGLWGPVRRS